MSERGRRRVRAGVAAVAMLGISLGGCVRMTAEERTWYEQWRSDPERPPIEEPHSDGAAFFLSLLFPGAGFFYLERTGAGVAWSIAGLPLWPLLIPAFVAKGQGEEINRIHIARTYHRLKPNGWGDGGQQQQHVNQNVNVNVVSPASSAPSASLVGSLVCASCGRINDEAQRYCGGCGARVGEALHRRE